MPDWICNNCQHVLSADDHYCSSCGQSAKVINRPWHEAVKEIFFELVDVDGRMMTSLRWLLLHPGKLSHEYIHGRRKAHTSPIRMYLVISLVFFFLLSLQSGAVLTGYSSSISMDRYSQAMFLLLPVFALLLKLFYRQTYYIAHLVCALYLFSAMFVIFAGMMFLETAADKYWVAAVAQAILLLYILGYCVVTFRTVYQNSWLKSAFKFLGVLALFLPILGGAIELTGYIFSR